MKQTQDPIDVFLHDAGWSVVFEDNRPSRGGDFVSIANVGLSEASRSALASFSNGIYQHQREAIATYLNGENVAVTTPTASGKTLIFNVCALEELSKNSKSRIAAIYPLKALASEQETRWKKLAIESGLPCKVGRIDGGVNMAERIRILKESRIVVLTPDIIHAWLLHSISNAAVLDFLRNLSVVVVDEAHTYSGVFGSNAAYLFRRLCHATEKLGGKFKYIASSATMDNACAHLSQLTGEQFAVIDSSSDTSPRAALRVLLVEPPKKGDLLNALSDLVSFAATKTSHQSITFVDSRKQTEYLATIVERRANEDADETEEIDYRRLSELQIYPYRSGYEEEDRDRIQKRLASGALRGVVSTSALEMGIDLPYLTLGILVGIPRSATSLYQRIGRVGRRTNGTVIVINNGSVVSQAIFREPERLSQLPLATSALYLHNQRIQYIHAMCLARQGGEDEVVSVKVGQKSETFSSPLSMPDDFTRLCEAERVGEIGLELQPMKAQAGDDPHHTFPLRDLDAQFKVEHRHGPNLYSLGSLSHSQVMREAYPGAVYYYQTRSYRVVRIKKQQRVIEVRPEKRYFTAPTFLPTKIFPNLAGDGLYQAQRYGNLIVVECAMQIAEAVVGFKERRGNSEFEISYPLDASLGLYHDTQKFARYAFTSGVLFTHPALNREQVKSAAIAQVIDEAFLMSLPFERQDINAGADKHRVGRDGVNAGDRFVALYDQTYGSLRLTSHLMKVDVLRDVFARATDIARNDTNFGLDWESLEALIEISTEVANEPQDVVAGVATISLNEQFVPIIMPDSMGIDTHKDNEEFDVAAVFYSPILQCVAYRGNYASSKKKAQSATANHSATTFTVRADHIKALDGESRTGYFCLETGEIVNQLPLPGEF